MGTSGKAGGSWIDVYCERTGPGLAAEPLNAVTNLAFLIAAWALWRTTRDHRNQNQRATPVSVALLPVLLALIGLCSLAFHTLATPWAAALDSLSIALFVHYYLVCVAHWFGGLLWRWAWLAAPGFALLTGLLVDWVGDSAVGVGATLSYLPALLALLGLALGLRIAGLDGDARRFAVAGAVFTCSLLLRAADQPACASFPAGTHFLWHLLNAVVLYLVGHILVTRSHLVGWRA